MAVSFDPKVALQYSVDPSTLAGLTAEHRLAELMAHGLNSTAIANVCNYSSRASANAAIQRLRLKMGWQAS